MGRRASALFLTSIGGPPGPIEGGRGTDVSPNFKLYGDGFLITITAHRLSEQEQRMRTPILAAVSFAISIVHASGAMAQVCPPSTVQQPREFEECSTREGDQIRIDTVDDPNRCQASCQRDSECRAWVYFNAVPQNNCRLLRDRVPARRSVMIAVRQAWFRIDRREREAAFNCSCNVFASGGPRRIGR